MVLKFVQFYEISKNLLPHFSPFFTFISRKSTTFFLEFDTALIDLFLNCYLGSGLAVFVKDRTEAEDVTLLGSGIQKKKKIIKIYIFHFLFYRK